MRHPSGVLGQYHQFRADAINVASHERSFGLARCGRPSGRAPLADDHSSALAGHSFRESNVGPEVLAQILIARLTNAFFQHLHVRSEQSNSRSFITRGESFVKCVHCACDRIAIRGCREGPPAGSQNHQCDQDGGN